MKVEVAILAYGLRGRKATLTSVRGRTQEVCKSRGGRPGLPVPNSPYCLCGRKATLDSNRAMGDNDQLYSLKRQNIIGEELNTQSRLQGHIPSSPGNRRDVHRRVSV